MELCLQFPAFSPLCPPEAALLLLLVVRRGSSPLRASHTCTGARGSRGACPALGSVAVTLREESCLSEGRPGRA